MHAGQSGCRRHSALDFSRSCLHLRASLGSKVLVDGDMHGAVLGKSVSSEQILVMPMAVGLGVGKNTDVGEGLQALLLQFLWNLSFWSLSSLALDSWCATFPTV